MKNQTLERKFVLGGEMKTEQGETLKEIVKQYYGAGTSADQKTIDECIKNVEARGFLEECRKAVAEQEKKRIHIGRLSINKVACLVSVVSIVILLCGFIVISYYIKGIKLDNKGDHEVIKYDLDSGSNTGKLKKIETYYDPAWVPEGYHLKWAIKHDKDYDVLYYSDDEDSDYKISYEQILPGLNPYLSTENGKHEEVSFREYSGEYVDTGDNLFLVVTDGIYVYIIISNKDINKDDLIRMLH